jgi:hypothetical protein
MSGQDFKNKNLSRQELCKSETSSQRTVDGNESHVFYSQSRNPSECGIAGDIVTRPAQLS